MNRSIVKQVGAFAGYLTIPLMIVLAIGLVAVRRFEWYILLGLVVLLVAIALFAATNPEAWQRRLGRQRVSSTISGIVVSIALLGIVVLVNVLLQRTNVQFDLTANKNFTISDLSVQVLQKLDAPVTATIFYDNTSQDTLTQAQDKLKQFAARSDKLKIQSFNANLDPAVANSYKIKQVPSIVFEKGQQREEVSSVDEQTFTRALARLQNPVTRRVLVVTGHQELSTQSNQQGLSLALAVQALSDNNFKVEVYNSVTSTSTPTGGANAAGQTAPPATIQLNPASDILLIAGPRGRFTDDEKNRISTFLKGGGKALVAFDIAANLNAAQATNLNDLLTGFGVSFKQGVAVETAPDRSSPQNPLTMLPELNTQSELARGLEGQNVIVFQTTNVEKAADNKGTFTDVLKTSAQSYLKTNLTSQTAEFEQGDLRGPLTVAATFEQPATAPLPPQTATPGTTPGAATPAPATNAQPLNTRLVLLGTPALISDRYLQSQGNYNFLVNSMNYLNESNNAIVIPSSTSNAKPFTVNESQSTLTFWSSFLGLPLLILFLGLVAWWRRR